MKNEKIDMGLGYYLEISNNGEVWYINSETKMLLVNCETDLDNLQIAIIKLKRIFRDKNFA